MTCRGEDGGDLSLSDVNIRRENLVCQVMGGESIFFPMFGDNEDATSVTESMVPQETHTSGGYIEESILDEIRELILQAQRHGCWKVGVGGIGQVSLFSLLSPLISDCTHIRNVRNISLLQTDTLLLCYTIFPYLLSSIVASSCGAIWKLTTMN